MDREEKSVGFNKLANPIMKENDTVILTKISFIRFYLDPKFCGQKEILVK